VFFNAVEQKMRIVVFVVGPCAQFDGDVQQQTQQDAGSKRAKGELRSD
jgi:hypothetical protein